MRSICSSLEAMILFASFIDFLEFQILQWFPGGDTGFIGSAKSAHGRPKCRKLPSRPSLAVSFVINWAFKGLSDMCRRAFIPKRRLY
jgi:hypothetical protein